jgi:hypothetical protein
VGGTYSNDSKKTRSSVLFLFWLDKQFMNSDRGNLKSFQTTVELEGNGCGVPKFSYKFSTCSSLPKFCDYNFSPDRLFQIHYLLRIVSHVSSLFIYSICELYVYCILTFNNLFQEELNILNIGPRQSQFRILQYIIH